MNVKDTYIERLVTAARAVLVSEPMATEVSGYDYCESSYCIYCRAEPFENPEWARAAERSIEFWQKEPKRAAPRMKISKKQTPVEEHPNWDRERQRQLAEYRVYSADYTRRWSNYVQQPKNQYLFNHKPDCAWLELANAVEAYN